MAAMLNAGLVLVLDDVVLPAGPPVVASAPITAADRGPVSSLVASASASASAVGLIAVTPPSLSLDAVLGVGDHAAWTGAAPARPRSAELPGDRAADRGGGADGGTATWTERRDRASDAALRKQPWNSPFAYRAPRSSGARRAASPESITRDDAAYGDRAPRLRARDGAIAPSGGDALGQGRSGLPLRSSTAVPDDTAGAPGATTPRRADGAPIATAEAAFVDRGPPAVDVARKGAPADDRAVAGASNQRRTDPFDLTPPRAGGDHDGEGVVGASAPGLIVDGWGRDGTAAARLEGAEGAGVSTFATRQDPYFVELFRRLDRTITYPRDLAIRMISGRVIAIVTLRADGTMTGLAIHAGSGHPEFDDQLAGALRRVGKLPPVPPALLEGRGDLRVMIPYTFRSPMIQ